MVTETPIYDQLRHELARIGAEGGRRSTASLVSKPSRHREVGEPPSGGTEPVSAWSLVNAYRSR